MDFSFAKTRPEQFQHTVKLVEIATQEIFYEKLTFVYLEMPKFEKNEAGLSTHFDKWLYLLKNRHKFRETPAVLQEHVFKKAFQIAEAANLNHEEMNAYEADLKYRRDWKNAMDFAVEKAVEETEEKTSREKQLEIARNLMTVGIDHTIIAQSTGLTVAEVETL